MTNNLKTHKTYKRKQTEGKTKQNEQNIETTHLSKI